MPPNKEAREPTRAPVQIAAVSIFVPLALAAVVLRIWIRRRMINSLGGDDIMMIVALVNFIVYGTCIMIILNNGGGTHIQVFARLRIAISWTLVAGAFYLTTIIFLKISLGMFFLRVLLKKWQRRVVYVTMILSTIINLSYCFFVVFACGNPKDYLENTILQKCINRKLEISFAYEQAAVTTVTDFIFAFLPIPMLWNASMDRRSKWSVGLILSLGCFGSVCSLVRFKYINDLADRKDFFWNAASVSVWSTNEMGTGIIAGCLATMRPLFSKILYRATNITRAAKGRKSPSPSKSSSKSSSEKKLRDSTSCPTSKSFQDWKESVDRSMGTYTTTCVGGHDLDLESAEELEDEKRPQMLQIAEEPQYSQDDWTKYPEKARMSRIWPYGNGISKVVDVEISVSHERPMSGFWDKHIAEPLQIPEKARKDHREDGGVQEWECLPDFYPVEPVYSTPRSVRSKFCRKGSRDEDIPEWDKLPDLISPTRPGTGGGTSTSSGNKSLPLIRVTSK